LLTPAVAQEIGLDASQELEDLALANDPIVGDVAIRATASRRDRARTYHCQHSLEQLRLDSLCDADAIDSHATDGPFAPLVGYAPFTLEEPRKVAPLDLCKPVWEPYAMRFSMPSGLAGLGFADAPRAESLGVDARFAQYARNCTGAHAIRSRKSYYSPAIEIFSHYSLLPICR
jgi:hypothetical protein